MVCLFFGYFNLFLSPTTGLLRIWCTNMCTRWGKLARRKSGQEAGQGEFTPRETWIYENFSFLRQHVIPTVGQQAKVNVDIVFFSF